MSDSKELSAAQKLVGDIAPKLAELTDDVLFGDVWERAELSKRDRSLGAKSPTSFCAGDNSFESDILILQLLVIHLWPKSDV